MSIAQLRSINGAKLRQRARTHVRRTVKYDGRSSVSWLTGYLAALEDVRKVVKNAGGPEHNVGSDVITFLDEMPIAIGGSHVVKIGHRHRSGATSKKSKQLRRNKSQDGTE